MRRSLATAVGVALSLAAVAAPAAADPASGSRASAYGLSATGLVPIAPTITAEASQPPDEDVIAPPQLLNVPLGGLALAGVVGVDAHAHSQDDIIPVLAGVAVTTNTSDPTTTAPVNAQGLAKTTGAALVFNNTGVDPIRTLLAEISTAVGGLLGADAVTAEAVARCVSGQPVFETGYQVVGLGGLVGDVIDPLVQPLLDQLLALVGPGSALSSIISVEAGRVTQLGDGVAIDGLVVRVPLLNQEIVVSHAEAHMPSDCGVEPPQPTGPGEIAPRATLAVTGIDVPYLPLAVVLVGAAYLTYRLSRRAQHPSIG